MKNYQNKFYDRFNKYYLNIIYKLLFLIFFYFKFITDFNKFPVFSNKFYEF